MHTPWNGITIMQNLSRYRQPCRQPFHCNMQHHVSQSHGTTGRTVAVHFRDFVEHKPYWIDHRQWKPDETFLVYIETSISSSPSTVMLPRAIIHIFNFLVLGAYGCIHLATNIYGDHASSKTWKSQIGLSSVRVVSMLEPVLVNTVQIWFK